MRIESVSARIPSLEISNERIIDEIGQFNHDQPARVVERYQRKVLHLLKKAGSKTRYFRDKANNETALNLVKSAMEDALRRADMKKSDIDLLIFCGVGRGFLEPANSYFCANAMGMQCQCFDVIDACMSWVRSLEIAYNFFKSGRYRHIMIVNAEFTVYEYGYPELLKIKSSKQIDYTFPAYTIGEAATATILSKSDNKWSFDFESAPELVNLCTIPLKGYEGFCNGNGNVAMNGVNGFVSFGVELFDAAVQRMVTLNQKMVKDINEPDIWFPHAAALNASMEAAEILGIQPEKMYANVFPKYGNVVSASIPLAMYMAINEERLQRGKKVILSPASAGMAFAVVQFEY